MGRRVVVPNAENASKAELDMAAKAAAHQSSTRQSENLLYTDRNLENRSRLVRKRMGRTRQEIEWLRQLPAGSDDGTG